MIAKPAVIYKTKISPFKFPYYRLTNFMDEQYQEPELLSWFDWLAARNIPCCIAEGCGPGYYQQLAVWVWGKEYGENEKMINAEEMGRIKKSYLWNYAVIDRDQDHEC